MAFPIITLERLNVKRTRPVPPRYRLGLIPAGCALRRVEHFLYPEGKPLALKRLKEWSSKNSFLEGKIYLDSSCNTVIVTAFFLEVLPPYASTWEGQTYTEVGEYPYLDSPRDILASIFRNELDDATRVVPNTELAWQQTDVTTNLNYLAKLVSETNQRQTAEDEPPALSTCQQRFSTSSSSLSSPVPCPRNHPPIYQARGLGSRQLGLLLRVRYSAPSWQTLCPGSASRRLTPCPLPPALL